VHSFAADPFASGSFAADPFPSDPLALLDPFALLNPAGCSALLAWPAAVVHISPLICLAALPRSDVMLCRHAVCGARIDVCMEGVRWAQRRRLELKPCVGRVAGAGGVGGWQWQGWQGQGIPQRCAEQSERDEMCGGQGVV